jgi:prevent-host-death family protein
MDAAWQLQDAKNRFSEVVDEALRSGPQVVTRRGRPVVVVVSIDAWERVAGPQPRFKHYLLSADFDLPELPRDEGERPDVELG